FPNYGCAPGSTGALPTQLLFVLAVPRHYIVPATQAWNLTIQRDLGKNWIVEVGYVGNHTIHLRETRTNVQARLATTANPIVVTGTDGNTYTITESTTSNGVARSNLEGVNGYGDRKSTRLNSSHVSISYAVFCLKKKNNRRRTYSTPTLTGSISSGIRTTS